MKVAIIESGEHEEYLTKGTEYVISDEIKIGKFTFFTILNDNGSKSRCVNKICPHLNGGNWKLTEKL